MLELEAGLSPIFWETSICYAVNQTLLCIIPVVKALIDLLGAPFCFAAVRTYTLFNLVELYSLPLLTL